MFLVFSSTEEMLEIVFPQSIELELQNVFLEVAVQQWSPYPCVAICVWYELSHLEPYASVI